jgi:hypothetical protein
VRRGRDTQSLRSGALRPRANSTARRDSDSLVDMPNSSAQPSGGVVSAAGSA